MSNAKIGHFLGEKITWSQKIQKCPIQREMAKKNSALVGGGGGLATVSLQFLDKHHKSNCHTNSRCCKSFFG